MSPIRTRLLVLAAALLAPASASASEPSHDVRVQSSWRQPDLPLQAEGPRLFLDLPPQWQPPLPDSGGLESLDLDLVLLRASRPLFDFSARMSGTTLLVDVQHRSFELGWVVSSQSAVMVLRFDPIPSRLR